MVIALCGCGSGAKNLLGVHDDKVTISGSITPTEAVSGDTIEVNASYQTSGTANLSEYHWAVKSGPGPGAWTFGILARHDFVVLNAPGEYVLEFSISWWDSDGDARTTRWSDHVIVAPTGGG